MTTNRTATWTVTFPDGTTATGGTTKTFAYAVVIQWGNRWTKLALCATEKAAQTRARAELAFKAKNPGVAYLDAVVVPVVMS